MNERLATWLVFLASVLVMSVAILGLDAVGANEATLALAFVIPLALCSYGISRVVMHYGPSNRDRR